MNQQRLRCPRRPIHEVLRDSEPRLTIDAAPPPHRLERSDKDKGANG